ncbi:MAG TPA: VCBS repeat domain-containing M23 family metallopeptidase [Nocardioidaceae bacterium]|nr:VCBS repeat domain-containing M23 family metallopeptidase [Nocardioidaceae bacterium]
MSGCPLRSALLRPVPPALAVLAGLLAVAPAAAAGTTTTSTAPTVDYEMPFPCAQAWTGDTRATHSPSPLALDFTRPRDYGRLVLAAAAGTVTRVADLGDTSYGRYVVIDHGDGNSTVYAHLKAVWVVQGQQIDQGGIVGQVGDTGNATGAHLHFEERVDGVDRPVWFHGSVYTAGTTLASANCPDVPVSADRNADGADTVGVFRSRARAGVFRFAVDGGTPEAVGFGRGRDVPVTGDWDGDGTTDVGVRRPGAREFLLRNGDGTTTSVVLGRRTNRPVTGDWDGDGRTDVGVFSAATATFLLRDGDGTLVRVPLGAVGSIPVTGDWNADGVTDVGVFDPAAATFTLRIGYADGSVTLTTVPFGTGSDLPVTGDWDGDGTTDVGTWDPATATFSLRLTPTGSRSTSDVTTFRFGRHR